MQGFAAKYYLSAAECGDFAEEPAGHDLAGQRHNMYLCNTISSSSPKAGVSEKKMSNKIELGNNLRIDEKRTISA